MSKSPLVRPPAGATPVLRRPTYLPSPNLNSPKSCFFPFDLSDSLVLDSLSPSFLSTTLPDSILVIMVLNHSSLPSLASSLAKSTACFHSSGPPTLPSSCLASSLSTLSCLSPRVSSRMASCSRASSRTSVSVLGLDASRTSTSGSGLRLLGVGHSEDFGLDPRACFHSRLYSFTDSEVVSRVSSVDDVAGVSFSFASVVVGGSMSLVLFITVHIQTGRTVHRTDTTDRHRQNHAPLYS